jgi:hypothetical protein
MTRLQALLIALSVAFAVVAGTYAAMQTTQLGTAASPHVSATVIARQQRALNRTAVALHNALRRKPPALPPLHHKRVTRYVYVQAPPAVAPPPHLTAAPPATHTHSSPVARRGEDGGGADD